MKAGDKVINTRTGETATVVDGGNGVFFYYPNLDLENGDIVRTIPNPTVER